MRHEGSRWNSPIGLMAQENQNWLKKNQIGSNLRKVRLSEYTATPYNAELRVAPKYVSSIMCVKMSADDRGIHNASCENRTPCVFPSQV